MKKKTKEMNKEENEERVDVLKTFFERLDSLRLHLKRMTDRHLQTKCLSTFQNNLQKCLNLKPSRETSEYLKKWSHARCNPLAVANAVNLLDLDDIDTSSLGNGKFLVYNSTTGKLEFTDQVDGN